MFEMYEIVPKDRDFIIAVFMIWFIWRNRHSLQKK